ncbi:hypothetical protein BJ085DRAFT_36330 [Dimargaris cristalligena]|uniref:RNI-like protein n=1 Tax=Dimargaris cristalligena TaxID=215637 RepID=A0A4P9ZQQ3_9FUNG|nr:hypothetical protein BJ085DRAFT_36330 [Dimargaris cristalligena]|eukprot:RKP35697.1 hypothetical protein BJ085DRAFT_36330 [Dimargaris cristalligena]
MSQSHQPHQPSRGILKAPTLQTSPSVWKRLQTKILPLGNSSHHSAGPASHGPSTSSQSPDQPEWNDILGSTLAQHGNPQQQYATPSLGNPTPVSPPSPRGAFAKLGFKRSPLANVSSLLKSASGSHASGQHHPHLSHHSLNHAKTTPSHSSHHLNVPSQTSSTSSASHKRYSLQPTPTPSGGGGIHRLTSALNGRTPVPNRSTDGPLPPDPMLMMMAPNQIPALQVPAPSPTLPGRLSLNLSRTSLLATPPLSSPSADALRKLDLLDPQTTMNPITIRRVRFSLPTIITEYGIDDRILSDSENEDGNSIESTNSAQASDKASPAVHVSPLSELNSSSKPTGELDSDIAAANKPLPPLPPRCSSNPQPDAMADVSVHGRSTAKPKRARSRRSKLSMSGAWQTHPPTIYPLELVLDAYRRSCLALYELPLQRIETILLNRISRGQSLSSLSLTGEILTRQSITPIAEMLDLSFGLRRLELDNCALDDSSLRILMHSLIYADQLEHLSLARNKRIKAEGMGYLATYIKESKRLKSLNLSGIAMDKKMVRYLCSVLVPRVWKGPLPMQSGGSAVSSSTESFPSCPGPSDHPGGAPPPPQFLRHCSLLILRLDNCGLKPAHLEQLALAIHFSQVRHLSLRLNRIPAFSVTTWAAPLLQPRPFIGALSRQRTEKRSSASVLDSPNDIAQSYDYTSNGTQRGSGSGTGSGSSINGNKSGPAHSTPPHLFTPLQPQYSTANMVGGMPLPSPSGQTDYFGSPPGSANSMMNGPQLPSTSLISLDLSDNELKAGVCEIGRLLQFHPNTLESLALRNNKLDPLILAGFTPYLSYNQGLRSLDLSHNPICGPQLKGIKALARSLTVNHDLRALFVEETGLMDEGAIVIAELLFEIRHLAHLNLSHNPGIDLAGVMALAASVKMNQSLVCLEVTIAPNNGIMSKLSQDILSVCVQNMERQQVERPAKPISPQASSSSARSAPSVSSSAASGSALSRTRSSTGQQQQRQASPNDTPTPTPATLPSSMTASEHTSPELRALTPPEMPNQEMAALSVDSKLPEETLPVNDDQNPTPSNGAMASADTLSSTEELMSIPPTPPHRTLSGMSSSSTESTGTQLSTESDESEVAVHTVDLKDLLASSFAESSNSPHSLLPTADATADGYMATSEEHIGGMDHTAGEIRVSPVVLSHDNKGTGLGSSKVLQFHAIMSPTLTVNHSQQQKPEAVGGGVPLNSPRFEQQNRAIREEEGRVLKKSKEVMSALIASPGLQSGSEDESDLSDISDEYLTTGTLSSESASATESPGSVVASEDAKNSPSSLESRSGGSDKSSASGTQSRTDYHASLEAHDDDNDAESLQSTNEPTVASMINRVQRSLSNPVPFNRGPKTSSGWGSAATSVTSPLNNPLNFLSRHLNISGTKPDSNDTTPTPTQGFQPESATMHNPKSASTATSGESFGPSSGESHNSFPRRTHRKRSSSWQHLMGSAAHTSNIWAGALLEDISGEELKVKLLQEDPVDLES